MQRCPKHRNRWPTQDSQQRTDARAGSAAAPESAAATSSAVLATAGAPRVIAFHLLRVLQTAQVTCFESADVLCICGSQAGGLMLRR